MAKRDAKKMYPELYRAPADPVLVEVPPLNYLMIDGEGDPNAETWYRDSVDALYAIAYSIKFLVKERDEALDFVVPPLEGLWWAEDMTAFAEGDRSAWQWSAMIMMPEPVDEELYLAGHKAACKKKCLVAAEFMRFEQYEEGLSAQVLHVGPYADEAPTIERLHAFIAEQGHKLNGKHHEIYLSDPRKTAAEKLKTILRQPVG
ncbi:MAG: hypothetical protein GX131_14485 [candidate division WS1 bacterium]|jgi:hypothetical protein|nr:hypothetical protein [candidate division WS1 bacterium]